MSAIWVPIMAIFFTFTSIVAIVFISLRYKARKLEHEEVMKAMEEGRELPTLEIHDRRKRDSDLKWGIILLATGGGLNLFLRNGTYEMSSISGIGYIPAFIGAGLIVLWFISSRSNGNGDSKS